MPATPHGFPRPKSPQVGEPQDFHTSHFLERQLDFLLHFLPANSGRWGWYVWVGVHLDKTSVQMKGSEQEAEDCPTCRKPRRLGRGGMGMGVFRERSQTRQEHRHSETNLVTKALQTLARVASVSRWEREGERKRTREDQRPSNTPGHPFLYQA